MSSSDDEHSDVDAGAQEVTSLANQDVVTKYRAAGDIAQRVLGKLAQLAKPGTRIVSLCTAGDALILKEVAAVYNKPVGKQRRKVPKGIAFPTCVSVNNIVGHFSPLASDETVLSQGDIVKIDLGVHLDGFCCVAAHTLVCGAEQVTGRAADVIVAAHTAVEAVARMLKPGNKNTQVTEMIEKIAAEFKVKPVQGVLSHVMDRNTIDGSKVIISRKDAENKVEECEFEANEVYSIDIVMSTGEGKPREVNERTTVFKRVPDVNYKLKMKASRYVYSELSKTENMFPFSLRSFEDETRARLGIVECERHGIVSGYPVLLEKDGEFVAHFKCTVLLLPGGTMKITGLPIDASAFNTDNQVKDEEIKQLLATELRQKKKKKKKAKKAAAAAEQASQQ